jgi:ATP-dependent protease ClpP protease subunit
MMPKKRKMDFISNYSLVNNKKNQKKNLGGINSNKDNKNGDDEEESEQPENPLVLPNLFSKEEDNLIYIKNNHLYFHTDVSEESVDKVKKLMRQYWNKVSSIKKTHECIDYKPKPLYIHIFSPGGCVYSGFSLYDFIIEYKKVIPIYTIVEGMVASAATFISIAGTKRFITPNSYMLIHQLSTFIGGNFEQIQDGYDNSKKSMEKIMQIYKIHTKINKKKIPKILKHDLNWDAGECIINGLVDEIKLIDIFNDNLNDIFNDICNDNNNNA